MTIIEGVKKEVKEDVKEEVKINEDMNVNFDKLRRMGSLSGWQRTLYNFITIRLGETLLAKAMGFIYKRVEKLVPEGTPDEDVKKIIKLALIDYVDSSL